MQFFATFIGFNFLVWRLRVGIDSQLTSISAFKGFQQKQKESKFYTVYSGISEHTKPLLLVGHAAEYKFDFKFYLPQVSSAAGNHSRRTIPEYD